MNNIIEKYQSKLSNYKPCVFDGYCGEPIAWGFQIISQIPEEEFKKLNTYYVYPNNWYVIEKWLSRKEAIEKYGKITEETFGPRGGWKSVTFGSTKFICKEMRKNYFSKSEND